MTRILIVEDDPAIRLNLQRLLRLEGFTTDVAENGLEALEKLADTLPDLILSDVSMPGMDGHQLLAELRSQPRTADLPFILLTAMADRASVRQGMNTGADDYITKPFQRDEVLEAIRVRLDRAARQQSVKATLEDEARRLRHLDAVTNLPNRVSLLERLPQALLAMEQAQSRLALIVIGLEGFSRINDSLGRVAGDHVLVTVASRLQAEIDSAIVASRFDGVARPDGVEFAVILAEVSDASHVSRLVENMLASIEKAIPLDGQDIYLGAHAGISLFPADSLDAETLLEQAETALNEAKRATAMPYAYYAAQMNALANERLRLHNDLHRAVERNELEVYYQPQLAVADGRIVGFEALVRWQHPELGMVSPVKFIPIAEENGQIIAIGAWVLETACRQMQDWLQRGAQLARMAVNLSARQFLASDLCEMVEQTLVRTGLPPAALELEITEGTAMYGAERTIATLSRLRNLGIKLALDDFGTGYSSLAYLKRFPLDVL
ncbi:MAG TPA: EAL domain-containing protein, partial [Rhodocyclaceae bacterium]|nr:EAL domain-containing protein [Rhodocyclaceae bacterium]